MRNGQKDRRSFLSMDLEVIIQKNFPVRETIQVH